MPKPAPHSTTRTRITVDGRTYNSVEEMPPQVRGHYEQAMQLLVDRDGNGIPDAIEGDPPNPKVISHISTTKSERFVVNGREYASRKELPPDLRRLLDGGQPHRLQLHWRGPSRVLLLMAGAIAGGAMVWLLMR